MRTRYLVFFLLVLSLCSCGRQLWCAKTSRQNDAVRKTTELQVPSVADAATTRTLGDPPWAESVAGVQVRLRADKREWAPGEEIRLHGELRNQASDEFWAQNPVGEWHAEIDGVWYWPAVMTWTGPAARLLESVAPVAFDLSISSDGTLLQDAWLAEHTSAVRAPIPGKHIMRVAVYGAFSRNGDPSLDPICASSIRALSNPVEIEIVGGAAAKPAAAPGTTDWLIVPGVRMGAITAQTSEADLAKAYCAENIKRDLLRWGEPPDLPCTVLFPDDPAKKVSITWQDPESRKRPDRVTISGERSLWHTREGLTLGAPLAEIEKLNGGPITISGFGWDYGGAVLDCAGGRLTFLDQPNNGGNYGERKLLMGVSSSDAQWEELSTKERKSVTGSQSLKSDNAVMRTLDLTISSMVVLFPEEPRTGEKSAATEEACRLLLEKLPEVRPDEDSPLVPEAALGEFVAALPGSADALLAYMRQPDHPLNRRAASVLQHLFGRLTQKQAEDFLALAFDVRTPARPSYPQGINAMIEAAYWLRDAPVGAERSDAKILKTLTRHFLDDKPYGRDFRYTGAAATTGWFELGALRVGTHSARLETDYELEYGGKTYRGTVRSAVCAFEVVPADTYPEMTTPADATLDERIAKSLRILTWDLEVSKHYGNPDHGPEIKWPEQNGRQAGAISLPVYRMADPSPVDLCFEVSIQTQDTSATYSAGPLYVKKGEKGEGYFYPRDLDTFTKGRPSGEIPLRIVLKPSLDLALTRPDVESYYNRTITSEVVQAYLTWGKDAEHPADMPSLGGTDVAR